MQCWARFYLPSDIITASTPECLVWILLLTELGRGLCAKTVRCHICISAPFFIIIKFLILVHNSCILSLYYLYCPFKQENLVSNIVPLAGCCVSLYFQLWPWKSKGSRTWVCSMFWDMSRSLFHLWPHTDTGVGQVLLQEKMQSFH